MPIGAGYVRVYQSILTDSKFEKVYKNDHLLATWLRLLLVADQMWPVPAPVPRSVRDSYIQLLVDVGLVDLMPLDCYRIHGLDAERNARRNASRIAAGSRWGNADRHAISMPLPSPSPRPSPSPSNGSQSDYDERVKRTKRVLQEEEERRARIIASES